jgi:hypothetical protein
VRREGYTTKGRDAVWQRQAQLANKQHHSTTRGSCQAVKSSAEEYGDARKGRGGEAERLSVPQRGAATLGSWEGCTSTPPSPPNPVHHTHPVNHHPPRPSPAARPAARSSLGSAHHVTAPQQPAGACATHQAPAGAATPHLFFKAQGSHKTANAAVAGVNCWSTAPDGMSICRWR